MKPQHVGRRRELPPTADWFTCACGKRGHVTKAGAARERRGHRGRKHLSVYRCDHPDGLNPPRWHLGHKPSQLIRGEISRDQVRDRTHTTHLHDMAAEHELADRYHREDHS